MRVLVCGGRDFVNTQLLCRVLDFQHEVCTFTMLIHGGAKGADALAGAWANKNNIEVSVFKPDWNKYGISAGPMRNKQMLKRGRPELVIAFPGGTGTANMIKQARAAKVRTLEIKP